MLNETIDPKKAGGLFDPAMVFPKMYLLKRA